jgi:hypothetical protein
VCVYVCVCVCVYVCVCVCVCVCVFVCGCNFSAHTFLTHWRFYRSTQAATELCPKGTTSNTGAQKIGDCFKTCADGAADCVVIDSINPVVGKVTSVRLPPLSTAEVGYMLSLFCFVVIGAVVRMTVPRIVLAKSDVRSTTTVIDGRGRLCLRLQKIAHTHSLIYFPRFLPCFTGFVFDDFRFCQSIITCRFYQTLTYSLFHLLTYSFVLYLTRCMWTSVDFWRRQMGEEWSITIIGRYVVQHNVFSPFVVVVGVIVLLFLRCTWMSVDFWRRRMGEELSITTIGRYVLRCNVIPFRVDFCCRVVVVMVRSAAPCVAVSFCTWVRSPIFVSRFFSVQCNTAVCVYGRRQPTKSETIGASIHVCRTTSEKVSVFRFKWYTVCLKYARPRLLCFLVLTSDRCPLWLDYDWTDTCSVSTWWHWRPSILK